MVRLAVNTAGVMAALGALARVASAQHADDDYTDDDYLDDDVWAMDQKRGVSNSETGSDGSTSKGLTETQQLVLVLVAGVAIVIVIVLAIYAYTGERRGQSTLILPTAHRKRNNRWSTWVPVGNGRRNLAAGSSSIWSSELSSNVSSSVIMGRGATAAKHVIPTTDENGSAPEPYTAQPARKVRPSSVWDAILNHEPSTLGRETELAEPVPEVNPLSEEYLTLQSAGGSSMERPKLTSNYV